MDGESKTILIKDNIISKFHVHDNRIDKNFIKFSGHYN